METSSHEQKLTALDHSQPQSSSASNRLSPLSQIEEARKHIARASALLRGSGPDGERIAWMLEDTIGLLDASEFESDIDFGADFEVITREFLPVTKISATTDAPATKRKVGRARKVSR